MKLKLVIALIIGFVAAAGKKHLLFLQAANIMLLMSKRICKYLSGKVNISAYTYELIKNRFDCTHRGKLNAKNLGDLDMYYVENEKTQTGMPELVGVSNQEPPCCDSSVGRNLIPFHHFSLAFILQTN